MPQRLRSESSRPTTGRSSTVKHCKPPQRCVMRACAMSGNRVASCTASRPWWAADGLKRKRPSDAWISRHQARVVPKEPRHGRATRGSVTITWPRSARSERSSPRQQHCKSPPQPPSWRCISPHPPCFLHLQLDDGRELPPHRMPNHPQLPLDDDGLRDVEALVRLAPREVDSAQHAGRAISLEEGRAVNLVGGAAGHEDEAGLPSRRPLPARPVLPLLTDQCWTWSSGRAALSSLTPASVTLVIPRLSKSKLLSSFTSFSAASVTLVSLRFRTCKLLSPFNSFRPASVTGVLSRANLCKPLSSVSPFSPASVTLVWSRIRICKRLSSFSSFSP